MTPYGIGSTAELCDYLALLGFALMQVREQLQSRID